MIKLVNRKLLNIENKLFNGQTYSFSNHLTYEVSFDFNEPLRIQLSESKFIDEFKNDCINILNEEQHINDNVVKERNKICNLILNDIKNVELKKTKINVVTEKHNTLKVKIFDDTYFVRYGCYFFKNENDCIKYLSEFNPIAYILKEKKVLTIVFINVEGYIDERYFYDAIQHELTHLYQMTLSNTNLVGNRNLYDIARQNIGSDANNGFNHALATIIYLSFEAEQDAFINGLNGFLENYPIRNKNDAFYVYDNSECGRYLKNLLYYMNALKEYKGNDLLIQAMKEVGNKYEDWYYKTAEKAYKRLHHLAMNVLYHFLEKNNLMEN